MKRIIANDGIDSSAADFLTSKGYEVDTTHYEPDDLAEELKRAQVLIVRSATKVREPLIDAAVEGGALKLIIRAGVGIDNIDHKYAESKGIAVRNTPNASSASVAELAIAHMFALARHLHIANVTMRQGEWNKKQYKGFELGGKTLGLIGFGRIAREVAVRALALGMHVQYFRRSGASDEMPACTFVDFDTLLATSDIVSIHIPYGKGLAPLIGESELSKMKQGAMLVNTARGSVLDENALVEALDSCHLCGAALDVFGAEPLANEAIMHHPRISMTPHVGASTKEAQKRIGDEIISVLEGFEF